MKRLTILLFMAAGIAAFSAAQAPGFEPFRQEGLASWYGREFDGKPTASGEIFNSALFTAAHPTLPFGTILTITNAQNNNQVTVRVNDRGPFVATRIIDLSMAAAEVLDMLTVGTAPVIVELAFAAALGHVPAAAPAAPVAAAEPAAAPAPIAVHAVPQAFPPAAPVTPVPVIQAVPQAAVTPVPVQAVPQAAVTPVPVIPAVPQAPAPFVQETPVVPVQAAPVAQAMFSAPPAELRGSIPAPGSTNLYRLQVGSYRVPRHAVESFERLRNSGLSPAYERNGDFYRVVLAGLRAGELSSIAQILGNAGFREALIRQETGN